METRKELKNMELRYTQAPVKVEKRAEGDKDVAIIEGYAAKYNQETVIGGWFREVVRPGFFDSVLTQDVRCLINHLPQYILARCKEGKGTLELFLDEVGLGYRFETPNISYAKDLQVSIERGDVSQSSFSFTASEERWTEKEGELDLRELLKCETLYDVSPVTFPAYEGTEVGKRSWEAHVAEKEKRQKDKNTNTESSSRAEGPKKLDEYEARYMFNINHSKK